MSLDPPLPVLPTPPLRRRLAAFVYEGVLLFGVLMMAGLAFSTLTQQRHALQGRLGLQLVAFGVLALYFVGFWSQAGQTLAMKTWRLRLVNADGGGPVTWPRGLLRYLLAWIWFVPPLALAWGMNWHASASVYGALGAWIALYASATRLHPQRQFWHDHWSGTRLVDCRTPAQSGA